MHQFCGIPVRHMLTIWLAVQHDSLAILGIERQGLLLLVATKDIACS